MPDSFFTTTATLDDPATADMSQTVFEPTTLLTRQASPPEPGPMTLLPCDRTVTYDTGHEVMAGALSGMCNDAKRDANKDANLLQKYGKACVECLVFAGRVERGHVTLRCPHAGASRDRLWNTKVDEMDLWTWKKLALSEAKYKFNTRLEPNVCFRCWQLQRPGNHINCPYPKNDEARHFVCEILYAGWIVFGEQLKDKFRGEFSTFEDFWKWRTQVNDRLCNLFRALSFILDRIRAHELLKKSPVKEP